MNIQTLGNWLKEDGPIDGASKTVNSAVYNRIRADILKCELAPGSRLSFSDLRSRYSVTISPLREALMRLSCDGLVSLEEHKGFRVASVSRLQLIDISETRIELECLAVRRSIERGDDAWESEVVGRYHQLSLRQSKLSDGTQDPVWNERHRAFHLSLYGACESGWLTHFCMLLFDQTERYRRLWFANVCDMRDVLGEHRQIMEAVISRDLKTSLSRIRAHVADTTNAILTVIPE